MRLNMIWRRLRNHLTVVAFMGLSVALQVGCGNHDTVLTIQKPTEVYGINPTSSPQAESDSSEMKVEPGKVLRVLKAGETAKAIGVYHGKDFDAFHVKLDDGTEGLIIASDTFTASSQ